MYLVIFVLNNPDLLEEIMSAWNKIGVDGATVFFSTGMERVRQKQGIRDDIPLIPSLDDFFEAPETLSRTIFTAVKDEAMIDKIVQTTQELVGDLNEPETGILLVTPILRAYGLEKKGKKL